MATSLDAETRALAAASAGLTALIGAWLALERAPITNPFSIPIYSHLVLFQDYYFVLPMFAVLVAGMVPAVRKAGGWIAGLCAPTPWRVAAAAVVLLALGARFVYHAVPVSMDEFSVVFQSKIFAAGRLTGQYPPALLDWLVPGIFRERFIAVSPASGQVAAVYWPGFSLLLTPFTWLGIPWLLNPLLGAATLLVVHRIALELFGDASTAGLATLLTLASPTVTMNALSFYSMPAHLLANAIFMLLLLRPSPGRALAAGAVGSLALVLHNPVPHALFALPWAVWLALRPGGARLLTCLVAGYVPLATFVGWGWPALLRELTAAGAAPTLLALASERLHAILEWRSSTGMTAHLFDACKLWLWSAPGIVAAAAWNLRQPRALEGPWPAILGTGLLTYLAYFIVQFDQGHGWGYRYFHPAWLVVPLLGVKALQSEQARSYLAGCALLGLLILTPLRALQIDHFIERHVAQRPSAPGREARVVLINPASGYYSWDLVQNDPFLRERVVNLLSRGRDADERMMAAAFPAYRELASGPAGSVWGVPPP